MSIFDLFTQRSITACLFDLDGVLTDTASVHMAAWTEMFNAFLKDREIGNESARAPFTSDDYLRDVDGRLREDGVRTFLASRHIELPEGRADDPPDANTIHGLATRKNELVHTILKRDGVKVFSGSVRFLDAVDAARIDTAVVSASRNTRAVLETVGLENRFAVCIDGNVAAEKRLRGKPAPDTYLAAAEELDVPPIQCAIFEDAKAGILAGRAGRFGLVIGVDRAGHADILRKAGANVVVSDLAELLEER